MSRIQLAREERSFIVKKIQDYFRSELDQDMGNMEAELLLDFFANELGGLYYNCGLRDAETVFQSKVDDISDTLYGLQKSSVLDN